MKRFNCLLVFGVMILSSYLPCQSQHTNFKDSLCYRKVILDSQNKIIPWYSPVDKAYDQFLRIRWDFIKTKVPYSPGPPPRDSYPQYYFYCEFVKKNGSIEPTQWMNDVGEKIPNWFENARLYYAYTGDESVMKIVQGLIDYSLKYGISPSNFAWSDFPYTTTNAGDTVFRGFTKHPKLVLHEIQVDHAAEIGLTYFRMYLYSSDEKYLIAAVKIADVLAANAKDGNASESVLPYRVVMENGRITAPYGANWTGCYMLFNNLIRFGHGNVQAYSVAREKIRQFLLNYPMKTGYWTDGHSDTDVKSPTYKSNLSASNMSLTMFDYPELDPDWKENIPKLIKWTEDYFVFRTSRGEPSTMWGANIVGEQDGFNFKMDYQTARYGAACARWYALSGDDSYRQKAYRSLNWVTYCNDPDGMAYESPVSKGINSWWSDTYGECPRMFYHAFAAVPEWAPKGENHILYSEGILRGVVYGNNKVQYIATGPSGTEYLRLAFCPLKVTLNKKKMNLKTDQSEEGYTYYDLGDGDYALQIKRNKAGVVVVRGR